MQSSDNVQVNDTGIIYRSYQLNPTIHPEGIDFQVYMENRFGSDFVAKFHQVEQVRKTEGLDFDFSTLPKAINTFHPPSHTYDSFVRWDSSGGKINKKICPENHKLVHYKESEF